MTVARTPGTQPPSVDLLSWPTAPFPTPAAPPRRVAPVARATVSGVERFYTTVEPTRERATVGWRDSTLATEETFSQMVCRMAVPTTVSRRGVAGNRKSAVFCQLWSERPVRSFVFDGCGRPARPGGLRRYQD